MDARAARRPAKFFQIKSDVEKPQKKSHIHPMHIFMIALFCLSGALAVAAPAPAVSTAIPAPTGPVESRIVSVYISQDFVNEQIAAHTKSNLIKELRIELEPEEDKIFLRGTVIIPVEEMRAINLDSRLGAFRFQVTIHLDATKEGHLILNFPLAETYFYPASSKGLTRDRVVIPVQMLSLALASVRGYLAALSGDFSGFDRRTAKAEALLRGIERNLAVEKNPDAREELQTQRESLKLQLASIPLERKQLQKISKDVERILGFMGEKELNLNQELGARQNALILKIKLSQLTPYLTGVDLGGVRVIHDKKDGNGQNYLVIDINSTLSTSAQIPPRVKGTPRTGMKVAPMMIVRIKQALLESTAVAEAEKKKMSPKIRDLRLNLKDDGLHVSGGYRAFFFTIPFETTVDFVSTATDIFEVRVRDLDIAGIDLDFLSKYVLAAIRTRLETTLKGLCAFEYLGTKDGAHAMQVTVKASDLVPAFPDLHLVDVDVREQEFLLKIGRP